MYNYKDKTGSYLDNFHYIHHIIISLLYDQIVTQNRRFQMGVSPLQSITSTAFNASFAQTKVICQRNHVGLSLLHYDSFNVQNRKINPNKIITIPQLRS